METRETIRLDSNAWQRQCVLTHGLEGAVTVTPSRDPAGATHWLRMTTVQALAPVVRFGRLPDLAITGDGTAVTPDPMLAIYPGPPVPRSLARSDPQTLRRTTTRGRPPPAFDVVGAATVNPARSNIDVVPMYAEADETRPSPGSTG